MQIDLFFTPAEVSEADLVNKTAVVIDVLRASTTVAWALFNGAREVIPVDTIGAASELKQKLGKDHVLLAGEREGVKIEGFDLGNSPSEYQSSVVKEKIVVYCSTNGSKAMLKAGQASLCLLGGLVNLSAVLEKVLDSGRDVVLVCSGTGGRFSLEDALCGGLLVSELRKRLRQDFAENDAAAVALSLYHQQGKDLLAALKSSAHGKYLVSLGFEQDLQTAAEVDSLAVVPVHEAGRFVWLAEKTEPGGVPRESPVGAG